MILQQKFPLQNAKQRVHIDAWWGKGKEPGFLLMRKQLEENETLHTWSWSKAPFLGRAWAGLPAHLLECEANFSQPVFSHL